jgi:hypothetical protein
VDVCVDGAEVKSNFTYKNRFTAELPAGEYRVVIRAAESGECTGARVRGANVTLDGGKNYTAAAGLSKRGNVKLFAFANDVRDLRNGVARVEIRHTAAAPRVDVWVNGSPAIRKFPNGAEAKVKLPAGDYTVRVAPAGTKTTVIGPRTFDLSGGRMAGQHGNSRVTVLNLEVVQADAERGLLLVKGAVPGPEGGLVMVRAAVKAPAVKGAS